MTDEAAQTPNSVGRLEISLDFELGWGAIENGLWQMREEKGVYQGLRGIFPKLLNALEAMEVPVTWATVGAMVENPHRRDLEHLPDEIRLTVRDAVKAANATTFDGRDLFEQLKGSTVAHHIAGHSYSHTRFSYPGVDTAFVGGDLDRSERSFATWSEKPEYFVFPQNHEGYYDVLREKGYRHVRGAPVPTGDGQRNGRIGSLKRMMFDPPPMAKEDTVARMRRTSGSMFFKARGGRLYALPFPYVRAQRGAGCAMREGRILHIWVHPFNFAETRMLLPLFLRFLRSACEARDAGRLEIKAPT